MATLVDVVDQLQEQNKSLNEVSTNIKDLLLAEVQTRKDEQRASGDQAEKDREAKNKGAVAKARGAPRSLAGGFAQGTGLAGMGESIKSFLGNAGTGLLGGATLGGLVGKGIGRLFFPAMAAFFSAQYLDKWVDPLVDKITGDDATFNVFGKDVDGSKIAAGLGGALALIFGKDAIVQAAKGVMGVGTGRAAALRTLFVRRFGLGAIGLGLAGVVGDAVEDAAGSAKAGDVANEVIKGVSLAMMFVPGGIVIRALAGVAIAGANLLADHFREQAAKQSEAFKKEVERQARQARFNEMSDNRLIELAKQQSLSKQTGTKEYYGRGSIDTAAYNAGLLKELEARGEDTTKYHDEAEIAYYISELQALQYSPMAAQGAADSLKRALADFKRTTGFDHAEGTAVLKQFNSGKMVNFEFQQEVVGFPSAATMSEANKEAARLRMIGNRNSKIAAALATVTETDAELQMNGVSRDLAPFGGFGRNITINNIDNSDNSTSTVSKGEVNNLMKPELNSIDAFHLNNYMHNDLLSGFK